MYFPGCWIADPITPFVERISLNNFVPDGGRKQNLLQRLEFKADFSTKPGLLQAQGPPADARVDSGRLLQEGEHPIVPSRQVFLLTAAGQGHTRDIQGVF